MFNQNLSPLRVAAYCRVSTDHDDQLNSLYNQQIYFADYIANQVNWTLTEIFFDEGISGTQTMNRKGFNSMIESAKNGNVDLILTKEVSRFARNTVDTLSYTRQLKELGVGVLFTLDHIDTRDCDGELRLTLMASIAQEESRKTSERVKWGQSRRMEQGVVFGRAPLGYRVTNGVLSINEKEAPIVQFIFHEYTEEGKSTFAIARELTNQGIYPKYASVWSASVIYRILKNEKYVGDLCQKKSCTPNYLTHKKISNPDKTSMIYLHDHHEAIVDRDLWNQTQKQLKLRSTTTTSLKKYSNCYWCSGIVYCGICGKTFVSHTKKLKNENIYHAWRCSAFAYNGRCKQTATGIRGCNNISINDQTLLTCVHYVFQDSGLLPLDISNYRKQIDFIRVFPDHTLIIQLKNVPWAHRLAIRTKGRLASYTTEILSCKRIERIQ